MSTTLRVKLPAGVYRGVGLADMMPDQELQFRPRSYATLADARAGEGAPSDANYVMWNNAWGNLETAFSILDTNDILVLPERAEPYLIDSSKGFMASNVKEVDGTNPSTGLKNGTRFPIVSNSRLWFEMSRARRGILGMGPGAVIRPSSSSWTQGRQPILQNEPSNSRTELAYMLDGSTVSLSGVQQKLIGCEHPSSFFANFVLQGRDFGGVAYNGLALQPPTGGNVKVKHIYFDGCWRGHQGVPNGESGGLTFLRGTYEIYGCDFRSEGGPSPIMWNRNEGGTVSYVRSSIPNYGMFTYFRSGGVNTWNNVYYDAKQIGFNLEENVAGFELDWTTGTMMLNHPESNNRFHLNINPSGGSIKARFHGVEFSPNGYTANRLSAHVYTTAGVQKKADVTSDTMPISYLNGTAGTGWLD